MYSTLDELQASAERSLAEADSIVNAATEAKRPLTPLENESINQKVAHAQAQLDEKRRLQTKKHTQAVEDARQKYSLNPSRAINGPLPERFTARYLEAFHKDYLGRGIKMSAALEEGVSSAGGFAVPVTVDNEVVPLAPQDSAIRRLAKVITTKGDLKVPQAATRGPAAAKTETSAFTISGPSLNQFLLTAFTNGVENQTSFEIAQDAEYFQAFVLEDMCTALLELEENFYVNGTGSGQAQGLIGNVGAGTTAEPDSNGNLVSISGTFDLIDSLPAKYHRNASFLMSRATATLIRKAQLNGNFYVPAMTVQDGKTYLHGYPCEFSYAMPSAQRGNTPVLFGSFSDGYVVGDRGGPAVLLKVLDQQYAQNGLVGLYAYRRSDGRVRRAEAIQSYTISAS